MKMTEMFVSLLEREGPRTRRVLEQVPEGRDDWQPHERSMPLGRLTTLVAGMPSWLAMMIQDDSMDLNPPGGSTYNPPPLLTRADRVKALEDGVAKSRAALANTTDEHLMKPWRLLVAGKVVKEDPRHVVLCDTLMHLSHHRAQLTVYLRVCGATVPAIYGPSADDPRFA